MLAAAVVLAAGCGGGKSAATTSATTGATTTSALTVTIHGRFHYPSSLIVSYMRSCTGGDAARQAYCGCTLDRLSNHVSTRDFTRIGTSGGKVPPRIERAIRRAALACRP